MSAWALEAFRKGRDETNELLPEVGALLLAEFLMMVRLTLKAR